MTFWQEMPCPCSESKCPEGALVQICNGYFPGQCSDGKGNKCLDGSNQIEPLNDEGDCGKSSSADQGKVFNLKTLQLKKFTRPI